MSFLSIKDLHVNIEDKKILNGVNLAVNKGEVHAIMGLNGSGKSHFGQCLVRPSPVFCNVWGCIG